MVLRPEQFTEQAREVLNNSQELVRRFNHSQWDVEHILLALLELEEGLPGDILNELGISDRRSEGQAAPGPRSRAPRWPTNRTRYTPPPGRNACWTTLRRSRNA